MPFNKKGILAACGAGALLFSMSALANNPPPTDPDPGDGGSSPYQRGPDPSVSFLEADRGNYSVSTSRVSGLVSGFGGGTIHYPSGTTGTMAAIVVIPGFVSAESSIEWWGPKLASYGFVVMTIDTVSAKVRRRIIVGSVSDTDSSRSSEALADLTGLRR